MTQKRKERELYMKKRILSMLLAVVMIVTLLPLGLVEPAEAVETLDTQRRAVTERAQEYIAACNNFSAQNGQSIPYWTISDAEFESYVQTKTRDKAAETSKLKKQVDAGDFMSALTTKTCTGSNGSHQWSNEKYTCRSHYFSGLDNRGGGYSQCQGFANYMAYVLFGEAGTSQSNFTKMTQVGYGFDFQPGDVLRVLDSNGKNGHSMVVYEGSGSSAKVIECNWGHSSRGYCNVRWDLTVAQKQKQFPTVETVWRPNASLAVTPGGTDSGGGTTEDVIGSGNCGANGANVTWKLTSDGTLTISGTGKMADYNYSAPWYDTRSQVKTVIIEHGVTSIVDMAFSYCDSLTSVTIPNSVTSIGNDALYGCSSLTSVTIPNSVTSIGWDAFMDCESLTDVYYGGYGIDWLAMDNHGLIPDSATVHFKGDLYGKGACGTNVNWVMTGDGTLTISGKGRISNYDYSNRAPWDECRAYIKCVVIKPGVRGIGDYAFFECSSLTSVTIPDSVTSIEDCAFENCSSLISVTIPNSVTRIGDWAFSYCSSLTDVYYGGYGLDWLAMDDHGDIPDSATVHFKGDLYGKGACGTNVNWVMTGDGTLTISGTGAMANYEWHGAPWYGARSQVKTVIIKNSVTSIGNNAFSGCSSLTSVTIPNSVTSIGANAFWSCSSLTDVTIPNSVTSIGSCAFAGCSSLTSVAIPNSITSIGAYAFNGCSALTSVTIPKSVTSIGEGAFYNCSSLTRVTIPNSVTSIGNYAFSCCSSLTNVTIPKSVTSIGEGAFYNCSSLTSVTIPKSVTRIDEKAFYYCDSLTDVYYGGTKADWKKITIKDGNEDLRNATLHAKPAAPADVKLTGAKAVNGGIQVTWQAAAGAAQYRVYRKDAANPKWTVLTSSATGTSYVDKTAKAGVKYTYTVRGINKDGVLSPSYDGHGVSATIPKTNAPANVTLTGAKVVTGGIQVTWKAASGATKYRVYRKDATNTGWKALTSSATGTSFLDKTAVAGVTYTYTVRGIASDGKTLSSSYDKIGVSAVIKPAKVVLISAKADSAGVLVTWQKAAGAHSYQVFRKTAGTGWKCIAKNIHDTEWKDIDAAKGTKYIYTVRAVADDGTTRGGYDKTGKPATVTKDPTTPAIVTLGKAVAGKNGITVTWSYAADARTYRVYRKAAGETKWTIVAKNATGKSWTDKNVTKGVKYTYTVRGVNANGKLSPGYNKTGVSAVAK